MDPQSQANLAQFSTMGLGGMAAYAVKANSRDQLVEALGWAKERQLETLVIGGGSNIVWRDEGFQGLLIINHITGFEMADQDDSSVLVTIGAGENWDSVVERTVQAGLTGIEALSLIPGSAGATPIQNVGAYGQEISQTLATVEAYDTQIGEFVHLAGSDCAFAYRTSRFKTNDRGRFYITSLTLRLHKGNPEPPFYKSVEAYFAERHIEHFTPAALRAAVIDIRTHKLPDPAVVHNTGSFFGNPIVTEAQFQELSAQYPDIPHWKAGEGHIKVSAAWLIEQVGFKDVHDEETGMATWPAQPLVLVSEHAHSTADLLKFKQEIVDAVEAKFRITLIQEPELLP